MLDILIVGGTRFFGKHFVNELATKYSQLVRISLLSKRLCQPHPSIKFFCGQKEHLLTSPSFAKRTFDCLIDFTVYSEKDAVYFNSVRANKKFMISSAYLTMAQAVEYHRDWSASENHYIKHKLEAEKEIADNGMGVSLRFPVISGCGDHTERFQDFVKLVLENDLDGQISDQPFHVLNAQRAAAVLTEFIFSDDLFGVIDIVPSFDQPILDFLNSIQTAVSQLDDGNKFTSAKKIPYSLKDHSYFLENCSRDLFVQNKVYDVGDISFDLWVPEDVRRVLSSDRL